MTILPYVLELFTFILFVPLISLIINFILFLKPLKVLKNVISLMFAPGIAIHEASHLFFCKILGTKIVDITYFKPYVCGFQGYVKTEEIESFLKAFLIGIAPAIVNSLLVYLVLKLYVLNFLNPFLTAYLMFSLIIGARPSIQDILTAFSVAAKYPSRFLSELLALVSPLASIFTYHYFQTLLGLNLGITGEVALTVLLFGPILYILFHREEGGRY